ncbi:MAG: hypothetical protein L7U59_05485 [Flavobacteriaceae bacterium]|jgi:hypothetical protein|nr:hypothetical protein [Flavobacteriaceae bacterium]MBT6128016.1 hypothetical protein [Flavobacteriaceae bacterium]MCH1453844.1 hypothetical protein [Flavobacteriaceae bacterium]MDG1028352.1 hypothetical protein [Flavobacteriaceae bacterium]MDG1942573.1 hypothetical protein [Flavobacteriaceae bacterium]
MERKIFFKLFLIPLLVFQLTSCDLFESTTVSSKEIKKASSWTKKDQAPSFPECESLEKEDQLDCFQNIISEQLLMSIFDANFVATFPLDENIILTLKVDKKGVISLLEAEIPNSVLEALPDLETTLNDAVANLPQALPATKTNVGVYVDTQFTLPIQIRAQPVE